MSGKLFNNYFLFGALTALKVLSSWTIIECRKWSRATRQRRCPPSRIFFSYGPVAARLPFFCGDSLIRYPSARFQTVLESLSIRGSNWKCENWFFCGVCIAIRKNKVTYSSSCLNPDEERPLWLMFLVNIWFMPSCSPPWCLWWAPATDFCTAGTGRRGRWDRWAPGERRQLAVKTWMSSLPPGMKWLKSPNRWSRLLFRLVHLSLSYLTPPSFYSI